MSAPRRLLYVDARQGASGDMILGSLVDLGVPLERIRGALERLPLGGFSITSRELVRCGLASTKVDVRVEGSQPARGWAAIRQIVEAGDLRPQVRERALAVFRRLIEAEAEVHGRSPDEVHLHEAGGTDAIVDIVGASVGLEELDVDEIVVSTMTTGFGDVRCAHGVYPIPAPATLLLVRGAPVRMGEIEAERLTPTGAAILTTVADRWGPMPEVRPLDVGHGAGERDLGDSPNVLRMILGEETGSARMPGTRRTAVTVLECTVDDATPQALAYAGRRLLAGGALEVITSSVGMKKSRVGHQMIVLCRPERLAEMAGILFKETPTLGLRVRHEERLELERHVNRVETSFGPIDVKVGRLGGETVQAWPEYEQCATLAERHGAALWDVQQAALQAHARLKPTKPPVPRTGHDPES